MRRRVAAPTILLYIGLTLLSLLWLTLFVMILLTAVRAQGDLISNGVFAWPEKFVWANFTRTWELGRFATYFRNSSLLILLKVPLGILIAALATWNELLIALVLISADAWRTVPVGLLHFQGQFSSRYTELMAGVLISILPILLIYIFLQRYMVSGLTAGALKE